MQTTKLLTHLGDGALGFTIKRHGIELHIEGTLEAHIAKAYCGKIIFLWTHVFSHHLLDFFASDIGADFILGNAPCSGAIARERGV